MSGVTLRRPIRIGISACLLGEKVRFDGGWHTALIRAH